MEVATEPIGTSTAIHPRSIAVDMASITDIGREDDSAEDSDAEEMAVVAQDMVEEDRLEEEAALEQEEVTKGVELLDVEECSFVLSKDLRQTMADEAITRSEERRVGKD